mgnify:CR=1 FL=1
MAGRREGGKEGGKGQRGCGAEEEEGSAGQGELGGGREESSGLLASCPLLPCSVGNNENSP